MPGVWGSSRHCCGLAQLLTPLDLLRAFEPARSSMSLSELATAASLARPTASRILYTLESLGYVRSHNAAFTLTPRVLELGMAYIQAVDIWDITRPHMERLVAHTHESSSVSYQRPPTKKPQVRAMIGR